MQGQIVIWRYQHPSATPSPGPEGPERPATQRRCRAGQVKHHIAVFKSLGFSPSPHHNCSGDCRREGFTELWTAERKNARGSLQLRENALTTTKREGFD